MDGFPPLEALIPHRPPMRLIDAVTGWDGETVTCLVEIAPGRPFVQAEGVHAVVCLEYMAQSAAACAALAAAGRDGAGGPPRPGVLLGTRSLDLYRDRLAPGTRLTVTARATWTGEALSSYDCEVRDGEEPVARATLSVALTSAALTADAQTPTHTQAHADS